MTKPSESSEPQGAQQAADETLRSVLGDRLFSDYANLVETDRKFSQLDLDNDGFLCEVELLNPCTPHPRAQEMLSSFDDIQNAHDDEYGMENDGITRADLDRSFAASAENRISNGDEHVMENGVDIQTHGNKGEEIWFLEIYDKSRDAHVEWFDHSLEVQNSKFVAHPFSTERSRMQKAEDAMQKISGDHSRDIVLGSAAASYENLVDGGASGAFAKIDSDDDGFLTQEELGDFVRNTKSGDEYVAAARMSMRIGEIEEASDDELGDENDGITKADLEEDLINKVFAADLERDIDTRLRTGLPGSRMDGDYASNLYDEQSGVSVYRVGDSQHITIDDARRGLETQIRFVDGTYSNWTSVDVVDVEEQLKAYLEFYEF